MPFVFKEETIFEFGINPIFVQQANLMFKTAGITARQDVQHGGSGLEMCQYLKQNLIEIVNVFQHMMREHQIESPAGKSCVTDSKKCAGGKALFCFLKRYGTDIRPEHFPIRRQSMSQDFGQCSVPASKVERLALFRQFKTSQDSQDSLFLLAGPGLLHIAMSIPLFMATNPSVPAKTLPEFIAYAKSNPGKVNMGSAGIGSGGHLAGELFNMMAGVNLVHVPYRGNGPALVALLGGEVEVVSGLAPGETVVVDGAFLLKAEAERSRGEGEHHEH